MKKDCCTTFKERMVVACSGASNLGQITNAVAVRMQQEGSGQMSCLAALGAQVDSYIDSANTSDLIIIDGCPIACGKKVAEKLGVSEYRYFEISQMLSDVKRAKIYDQVDEHAAVAFNLVVNAL